MILYALERLFDYLFQYLVANLVVNLQNDKNLLNQNEVTASDEPSNNDLSPQSDTPYDVSSSESPDKTCHINVCYMDPVQKRIVNYNMEVNRSMKVEDVKRQLQGQLNDKVENWSNLAVLFMGKELSNGMDIDSCDLGDYSLLHVLDTEKVKMLNKNLSQFTEPTGASSAPPSSLTELPTRLTTIEEPETTNREMGNFSSHTTEVDAKRKLYFFVFCQACDSMCPGKLRVVCSQCDHGSILFQREPQSWADLLDPSGIECKCYTPGCNGKQARFFFKCIEETKHPQEAKSGPVLPLNRLRRNAIKVKCLACLGTDAEIVLVWPHCDHVICLDCFRDYGKTALSERRLSLIDSLGYTVNCPIDAPSCEASWIETPHLRLLDAHSYSLYRKQETEELVFQNGGILCPFSDCDEAHYPPTSPPTSCQAIQCVKCKLTYCVYCTLEGPLTAPVNCTFESFIEQTNALIRQNRSKEEASDGAKTYLASLVEKFAILRRMAGRVTGTGSSEEEEAPRWQETMSRLKIRSIAKPCPRCKIATERDGGCMHMVCGRGNCRFEWCWVCLIEWNSDCMATHWFG